MPTTAQPRSEAGLRNVCETRCVFERFPARLALVMMILARMCGASMFRVKSLGCIRFGGPILIQVICWQLVELVLQQAVTCTHHVGHLAQSLVPGSWVGVILSQWLEMPAVGLILAAMLLLLVGKGAQCKLPGRPSQG